jgi:nucleotide-binding universal stress UspA family protein
LPEEEEKKNKMTPHAASSMDPWKNVLVALDDSEESTSILEHARHLLARESLAVTFLRVIECSESHARDPAYLTDSRHRKAREMVSAAREAFAGRSGTANAEFRFGNPATEILREIVDGGHDVALLNWHGNRWLGRPVSESVANRVLMSSPVPILYFPAPAAEDVGAPSMPVRFDRVLVILDGSPEAEEILPFAERMARTLGSDLHLFQAVRPGKDETARRRDAERYLTGLARHLGSRGIVCQIQVRTGPARQAVADLLNERRFDALALATHARSGLAQVLRGSLTKDLLRSARVPILTVCMSDHRRLIPISGQREPLRVE